MPQGDTILRVAELVRATDLARHRPIAVRGPDLLAHEIHKDEVMRRLRAHAAEPSADVRRRRLDRPARDTPVVRVDIELLAAEKATQRDARCHRKLDGEA